LKSWRSDEVIDRYTSQNLNAGTEPNPVLTESRSKAQAAFDTGDADRLGAIWARVYSTLWYPALPLALLTAGGGRQSRRERLGGVAADADMIGDEQLTVWLHAASVGEIEGIRPVVQSLARLRPDLEFVITTMTRAGQDAARRRLNGICQLAPFDHAPAVRAFVARIRPVLLIITETELWPNLFLQSAAAGIRISVINGRISLRSMSRYRLIRPLLARALRCVSVVLAQTTEDAERFCMLGAPPQRVVVGGNAKYEVNGDSPPLRPELAGFAEGQQIIVAGSTGPGEEQIALAAYRRLIERFPSLALVLAPRHLHRIDEVERAVRAAGFACTRASESSSAQGLSDGPRQIRQSLTSPDLGEGRWSFSDARLPNRNERATGKTGEGLRPQILLLDTMGELRGLYRRATVAFVGGSLMPGRGGQSLAEPASSAVPVLFGPFYENHRQLGEALLAAGGGRVVHDATQLADASAQWLIDEAARDAAGQRARSVIEQIAGNTATMVRYLCALLPAS
jgi:3-deoxy-D-manno-octulosonic-acid transferase